MGADHLVTIHRKIVGLFCLLVLIQCQVVLSHSHSHRDRLHHRFTHTVRSRSNKSPSPEPRRTKFSDLGIYGIRASSPKTAKIDGTFIGIIPDAGDTGGKPQTMSSIIKSLNGKRPACYGWYAQVFPDKKFDGSQLYEVMDDLKKCQCVFTPAIMPMRGWAGFRRHNNFQAVAIAKVLRNFTDASIPVILRFAHEANWYQTTFDYGGHAEDFKEAWDVLAKAIGEYSPEVLLHWTPNVASMDEYRRYAPYNLSTVNIVGLDYYPTGKPKSDDFVKKVKEFHDEFAVDGRKFAMGEAGLHYKASYKERIDWLTQMASSRKELPNLVFINWYNSQKEYDYKIAGSGVSTSLLTERLE